MNDTRIYRELIKPLAKGRVNRRIPNGYKAHASILFEAMFDNARDEIRIFSGELHPEVYGTPRLVRAAQRFLAEPGRRLSILLQRQQDESWAKLHPLLSRLSSEGIEGDVEVRFARGTYSTDEANHFAVMDDCGYRFERDHTATKAVANFNEPEVAAQLTGMFDRAFALGVPLENAIR